ncbi:uncharacterized protein LOC118423632 [Branchiostoma floridae]|uniref:Uncharacterized protein LOC118423632 n=1 Tax=Branchiostoma floridae TaxID=7739 RepID=A0A9J7LT27_BRAFL|nr:uncharacterized protein LOC118423632 [Branchiostoma floridae]
MTKLYVFMCLLGVMSLTQTLKITPYPQPPIWPSAFSVAFHEKFDIPIIPSSDGAWYYDYSTRRTRFDHLQGQDNNFCQGRGLKLQNNHSDCHLIFTPADMYVHYPQERQCCRACGAAEGCTVLKPDWLAGAKYTGKQTISGMVCHGWEKQGAVAVDRWYQTEDGTPCQYWEKLTIPPHLEVLHTITFNSSTSNVGPVPKSIFDVPNYCNTTCPFPWGPHDE